MRFDDKRPELSHGGVPPAGTPSRAMQVVAKAIALIGGAILIVSALALSLIFFAVLIVAGVLIGGYLWWKTRELRKQVRTQFESSAPFQTDRGRGEAMKGEIIEGEIIEGEIVGRGTPEDARPVNDPASHRTLE